MIKLDDFHFNNILIDEKSHENISIYNIYIKNWRDWRETFEC